MYAESEMKIDLGSAILEVHLDETPEDPRNFSNLGKMVCWHPHFILGDEHDYRSPEDFLNEVKPFSRKAVILPLYLYDHTGLQMNTEGFHLVDPCRWDWGQVGWIYVTREDIRKEFGVKRVTQKVREKVTEALKTEVKTYSQFLEGDIYGFILTDKKTGEVIDSCWGFYGPDPRINGIMEHLPAELRKMLA